MPSLGNAFRGLGPFDLGSTLKKVTTPIRVVKENAFRPASKVVGADTKIVAKTGASKLADEGVPPKASSSSSIGQKLKDNGWNITNTAIGGLGILMGIPYLMSVFKKSDNADGSGLPGSANGMDPFGLAALLGPQSASIAYSGSSCFLWLLCCCLFLIGLIGLVGSNNK